MKQMLQNIQKRTYLLLGINLVSILLVLFYILYCTKGIFHSDMAYWLIWADEQIKNGQFYPDNFCYTTGVPSIVSTQLFVLFLRFFSNDWIWCREIAVIIVSFILFVLIYQFYKNTLSSSGVLQATCFTIIILCLPMGQYHQTFYEAAYVWQSIWDMLLMLFTYKILFSSSVTQNKKREIGLYVGLFVAVFLNSMSVKNIAIFAIPFILSFLILRFLESQYRFELVFKNKKYNKIILISAIGIVLGFASYILLARYVNLKSNGVGMTFVGYDSVYENFIQLIVNVFYYYKAAEAGSVFSLGAINSCINFVIMCFSAVLMPIWALVHYIRSDNQFWKLYTIYAWISNFLVIYFMVFTSANHYGYYRPVFWHNTIFTALFLAYIIKQHGKYYECFIIFCLVMIVGCGHLNYVKTTVLPIRADYQKEEVQGTLIDFLQENDLDYGFASFWHAYKYMALSNGEIKLIAYEGVPTNPYYWMTSRTYYNVEKHPGKCFLLVANSENVDQKFYDVATEIKEFQDYKILIYDKHLYLYEELK